MLRKVSDFSVRVWELIELMQFFLVVSINPCRGHSWALESGGSEKGGSSPCVCARARVCVCSVDMTSLGSFDIFTKNRKCVCRFAPLFEGDTT